MCYLVSLMNTDLVPLRDGSHVCIPGWLKIVKDL